MDIPRFHGVLAGISMAIFIDFAVGSGQVTQNPGGLNRSMQHWLAVYSPAFQSPKFVAGVD